ncbi:MAG: ABC transporter ATP-binding protein [bacterium]
MKNIAIKCENLGKEYKIGSSEKYLSIRDSIVSVIKYPIDLLKGKKRKRKEKIWALKDASFEIEKGEVIGIIGKNGAGKSTLLKLLCKITEPTEGEVVIKGKVASLLEVGTGFHEELTGRENIYLNGAILGMKKKEIDEKFEQIVKFSGVEKFLDTPVKRYSSGMKVRLAFSVAAHIEPEILLVDEVLAVGDVEFQNKCMGKMNEITKGSGRTILFVSHNMGAIRSLCKKCILLDKGRLVDYGDTDGIIKKYLGEHIISSGEKVWKDGLMDRKVDGLIVEAIRVKNDNNEIISGALSNEPISIEIDYELKNDIPSFKIGFRLETDMGVAIFSAFDIDYKNDSHISKKGRYRSTFIIPKHLLNQNDYFVTLIGGTIGGIRMIVIEQIIRIRIEGLIRSGRVFRKRYGIINPKLKWQETKIE